MKRIPPILSCWVWATTLWGADLLVEDFSTAANPSNVVGSVPLNQWYLDGSTEWQKEGWAGTSTDSSVYIADGASLSAALQLGWRADNIEVRHVLLSPWNFRRDYVLTGEWEKIDDSGDVHLGFHVYLSEVSATGHVQHVKHLHVDPGNPPIGATNGFSLTVSALELIDVHVNPSNHIGITFVHSEDADLEDESTSPSAFALKNDMFLVDNLVLTESETDSPGLAGAIMQPVYLSESGTNTNDGLSPAQAWRNVNALDAHTFGPGARILFKRGETFPGACTLQGDGVAAEPILVAAYGTGDKPLLTGWWDRPEIFRLTGNEGVEFRDLRFSNFNTNNASIKHRYGIHMDSPEGAGDMRYLHFIDLDFFDIQGAGAADPEQDHQSQGIWGRTDGNDAAAVPSRWNDLLIEGCAFVDIDGRGAQITDTCLDITDVIVRGSTNYFPTVGFVFQHNRGTNCYRNLLQIRGTKDALIQYNTMDTTVEGSAFWPFGTDGTLVQFNVWKHLRAFDADCYVCHFDYNCIGTIMQYNVGIDVEGGLIELLVNSANPAYFQEGAIARYNLGIDVGWRDKPNGAGIFITGRVDGAQVYNNTVITLQRPAYRALSFNNWGGAWPRNCEIYNNLFFAAGTPVGYNREDKMSENGNVVSRNLYHGMIAACAADLNPFTGDPRFLDPAGFTAEDFKVGYGSAAIANGVILSGNGGRDFFEHALPVGERPTLGFHEYPSDPTIDSDGDAMFDPWETGYGLDPGDPGDATGDPDGDRLQNLYEFGVGGDPTNGVDLGHVPTAGLVDLEGGLRRFVYVYPRRTDAAEIGLDYDLGVTANLVDGPWINSAHWISGIGEEGFGEGFDAVTNYLSLDNEWDQRFMRLELEAGE